jgi:hypothetical protein
MAANSSIKSNIKVFGYVAVMAGVAAFIRHEYGLDTLRRLAPYLIGVPAAYVILHIVLLIPRLRRETADTFTRRQNTYALIVAIAWVVLIAFAPFQPWLHHTAWNFLASILMLGALIVPQLIQNRRTHGTWLIRRPLRQPPPTEVNRL